MDFVVNETCKELVEISGALVVGTAKNIGTFALLMTVMPPIFIMGCVGTTAIFAYETSERIMEATKVTQRGSRKR